MGLQNTGDLEGLPMKKMIKWFFFSHESPNKKCYLFKKFQIYINQFLAP